jgi:serine/threonine-protein kinase
MEASSLPPNIDRDWLLGALALEGGRITAVQLMTAWSEHQNKPLADVLVARGWLSPEDRASLENRLHEMISHQSVSTVLWAGKSGQETDPAYQPAAAGDTRSGGSRLEGTGVWGTSSAAAENAREAFSSDDGGRFTILRLHAKGGLGQVSVARDESLRRQVAVKELRPDRRNDPTLRQRFLTEAEITGQLEHPGIVPVYALGQDSHGQPFYAMRLIQGGTLEESIAAYHAQPTPLAFRGLLERFVDVCQTMAYVHSKGVIHRDLKPVNIMVGEFGETLVLDWGLAKRIGTAEPARVAAAMPVEKGLTEVGQVLGTPAYMAPEQAEGVARDVGPASDIYALGAILYKLLTGSPPFGNEGTGREMLAQLHQMPAPPSQHCRGVPRALEAVCLKALASRPQDRYASAQDLASEVEHWLAGEPVKAYPEPWTLRTRRWLGRHRTLVAGTLAAVLVAVVSLSVATVFLTAAKNLAQRRQQEAQANFQLARDAVDAMLTEVSEDKLRHVPEMDAVRRTLLEKAVGFYQQFLETKGDDPAVRGETGRAFKRLADIYLLLGQRADTTQAYQQGADILEELTASYPAVPDYREWLASVYQGQGWMHYGSSQVPEAESAYEKARTLLESLVAEDPSAPVPRSALGITYNSLALLYRDTRRPKEAEPVYQKALAIREQLVSDFPDDVKYQAALAQTLNNLGNFYALSRRPDEALATHERALPLRERLVSAQPGNIDYQSELALSYGNLALLHKDAGRFAPAEELFGKALPIEEKLARLHPARTDLAIRYGRTLMNRGTFENDRDHPQDGPAWFARAAVTFEGVLALDKANGQAQAYLGHAHWAWAESLSDQGKSQEARPHWDRALELATDRSKTTIRAERAVNLAQLGEYLKAAAEIESLPGKALKPEVIYESARALGECACAVERDIKLPSGERASLADHYSQRSLELLNQSQAAGYFQDPGQVKRLRADASFKEVRKQAGYQAFESKLKKK